MLAAHRGTVDFDHLTNHNVTPGTPHGIAMQFDSHGKEDDAPKWDQHALAGSERLFGKGHVSTLKSVNNVVCIYSRQDRYQQELVRAVVEQL